MSTLTTYFSVGVIGGITIINASVHAGIEMIVGLLFKVLVVFI